nr:hypothetical protein CFP56_78099 [Quercus suber]
MRRLSYGGSFAVHHGISMSAPCCLELQVCSACDNGGPRGQHDSVVRKVGVHSVLSMRPKTMPALLTSWDRHEHLASWLLDLAPEDRAGSRGRIWLRTHLFDAGTLQPTGLSQSITL